MSVCGIDPGKGGGFAIFNYVGTLIIAGPLDFDKPNLLTEVLIDFGVREILIERAQAAPKQGISTAFEYGRAFGRTEAACMAAPKADIYYCAPAWWKGKLAVPADKSLAQEKALKKVPYLEKFVTLQKHNGIAEAALMAQVLLDDRLFQELVANNKIREKPKKKRPSFRL